MKRRQIEPELDSNRAERSLCEALLTLRSVAEVRAFLDDLCTPAERESMRDRWSVVPHLLTGEPYWQIHDATAVSITTIGRVARCLEQGSGGYVLAASRTRSPRKTAATKTARSAG
ncbi:MAG: YerC/YecD family TrpR-related protein [Dokdonella sp.]